MNKKSMLIIITTLIISMVVVSNKASAYGPDKVIWTDYSTVGGSGDANPADENYLGQTVWLFEDKVKVGTKLTSEYIYTQNRHNMDYADYVDDSWKVTDRDCVGVLNKYYTKCKFEFTYQGGYDTSIYIGDRPTMYFASINSYKNGGSSDFDFGHTFFFNNLVKDGDPTPSDPTPPIPTPPTVTPPEFPGWSTDLSQGVEGLQVDFENNNGSQAPPLFDVGTSNELTIRHSNVAHDGIINLSGTEFKPEIILKNKNDVFTIPMLKTSSDVKQAEVTKLWNKYKASGNTVDLFIYEVKDHTSLPANPGDLFNKSKVEFKYFKTMTNETIDLTDFKITKPGYYALGARVKSGANTHYEVRAVKVSFINRVGWLPIKNDLSKQYNEKMLVASLIKGDHKLLDLTFENYKSLKAPSTVNKKYETTAIGSSKGGITFTDKDIKPIAITGSLTGTVKVREILSYQDGYLVATNGSGLHYVDLKEKKSFKVNGTPSDIINDIYEENGNIFVTNDTSLTTGEIVINTDTTSKLITNATLVTNNTISNSDIFKDNSKVGSIEVMLNKILVTTSVGSGNPSVAIIDKF